MTQNYTISDLIRNILKLFLLHIDRYAWLCGRVALRKKYFTVYITCPQIFTNFYEFSRIKTNWHGLKRHLFHNLFQI